VASAIAQKVPQSIPVIDVWNKLDSAPRPAAEGLGGAAQTDRAGHRSIPISARTGEGLDRLRRVLLEVAGWQSAPEGIYIARARHVQALEAVGAHLQEAQGQLSARGPALDLLAEELRLAQNALSAITGEFTSDDLLGVIFSSFCIGK
jgi:tRNA modification GTPase